MAKRIIVNVIPEETRMAMAEDSLLLEVAVERTESSYMVGNIYKGRVENVLPGMQAAFINIGIGKNAFLYAGDIFPHKSFQRLVSEDNLTVGAEIMIEIVKDAMGSKGPRATTHFSIPGRYVVVMPSVDYVGVSRRIESPEERSRLRALAEKIRPKGMGVIVRTVAEGHSEDELARDFQYLNNLWSALTAKAKRAKAPLLLYRDADLAVRIIRDHVKDDIDEVIVDNVDTHARMVELAKFISPDLVNKISLYKAQTDIFTHYGIEDEWGRLADRRVDLKCGGYLIIDKTEALTVIDVNTGRFIGHSNLADTVFRANMEAAAEIARQLRLRDIGGIIVADFIDMQKEGHKKAILAELEAKLKADNTKTNVLGLTELGLVEMTRKKSRQTYESTLYENCPCCNGRGIVQSPETLIIGIHRQLRRIASKKPGAALVLQMHPVIAEKFGGQKAAETLARELGVELTLELVQSLQMEIYSIFEEGKLLVRSEESKKVRKPSSRRVREEEIYDGQAQATPLLPEEMAPLLAENFAMEAPQEPKLTLEMRLAAMTDSLWGPLIEPDEPDEPDEQGAIVAELIQGADAETPELEAKKPRRRRRSKKSVKLSAAEVAAALEEEPVSSGSDVVSEEQEVIEEEPKKKKTRRRRRKKKSGDKLAEPTAVDESAMLADMAVEEDSLPAALEEDVAAPEAKKSRRRRRKKKKVAAPEADVAVFAPEPETEDISVSGEAFMEKDVLPSAKTKRRRKRKKTTTKQEAPIAEAASSEAAPIEASMQPAAGDAAIVAEEPGIVAKTKRRRKKKKAAVLEEAPPDETIQAEAEPYPAASELSLAEEAVDVKAPRRRRRKKPPAAQTEDIAAPAVNQAEVSAATFPGEGGQDTDQLVKKKASSQFDEKEKRGSFGGSNRYGRSVATGA